MIHLSPYQWRIITFVQSYIAKHGMSPSVREIADGSGISSTSIINYNLNILEGDGLITRQPFTSRSIVLQSGKVGFRP